MVKVCTVCGDRGFTDLLVTCNQCNDLAEHVYCMQTLSDYAPDADWSCVECKLKQKTSTQKIALMPSHPITKQSQAESNKRQIEDTISIPVSKKRAVESSNVESLLERDSSLVTLEADKGDICAVSQQIDISLHSRDGLPKVPQTGKFDCGSTTLLQDNGSSQRSLCKDNSSNILCCQQSSSSMAQVSSALTSSGSKRQLLDKSQDPLPQFLLSSRPAASARGQRTFKGSKEIGSGSGNSSSHDKFSDLRGTLEHKKKLKDLVPDISRKDMEITKNIAKLIKGGTDGSELGKNLKESTSLGMEKEDCKGIMPKVKSTGSSSKKLKLDKNDCNDPISRDDVFKRSKSVHDDCQTLASRNGVCLPITEGQSNMASVEKALTKTLHCQNINQPSTVYLPDTVASFSDKLNSGENKSTITKHDIDKVVSCSADKAFQEKQNNVNEQAHKSDNSTIQLKTLPLYGEGNKLDANPGALHDGARTPSNGHPEALFNTTANCLKPGATIPAPINFSQERGPSAEMAHSMTRSLEINLSSSSAMQNDPSYVGERAGMPGSFPSSMDSSSPTHLPHQKPLTVPQSRFLWKGAFKVMGSVSGHCIYDGIQAHPSNTASPKVYEMTKKFTPQLHLEQVQRCNIWPKRFHKDPPTDDNIGLYFFPTDDERCEKSYAKLLKEANDHDLAMRMYLDSAELLIFSSIQLPERFQSIRGKFYFWGVFRGRGNSPSVCKVQEILSPSKHVGANVLQADSSVLSVTRVLMLPDMRKHGVGEECTKIDTKGQNRKHDIGSDYQEFSLGFHSTCSSALPPSSDHLLEKQGFEHFQAEPDRKSEAEKEMVLRSHPHAYLSRQEGSCRKHGDGPHNSHQSSFSSGQSDRSSGSKERSVSPLALGRKKGNRCENSININRIRIFKESHIHMQTRREEEMKETVREHAKVRTGRHREKWNHRPRINFRKTGQMEHQRRKHDDVNNRDGSRSLFCSQSRSSRSRSESQSQLYKRSYSLSVGKPWSPDAGIVVPCHTVNSPDSYLHKSSRHEKLLLQRDSSSEVQIDNRNYNEKGSAVVGGDNCRKGEKETYSKKRVEGMSLLDVEEGFSVRSPEGSAGQDRSAGQDQPTKDQWSFTPLQNVTDEATEKCNVSEVSNAASLLDSRDSMCSGENVPHELTEADLSGVVNPRTEYVPGAGDQYPVTEQGPWYTCSSSEQTDSEPVPCLELFPLEEENLGVAKNVVNNWDIDLELGLGRSSSKKRLPDFEQAFCEKFNLDSMAGSEVFSNGSMMEFSPCENSLDMGAILSLSVPHIQK